MLLLTLLFASSALATPLLGTEQCARGPTYWCQNVKAASLCGAVTHCQQNVWNKPHMKTVPCTLCKEVLTVVDQILKDNATESEILGYLEKACQLIPDEGLTAECKEMVDNYYPILMGIITGELEAPDVVCAALGLCQTEQAALAKVQAKEQLMSNEIPQVDLAQPVAPFILNVPQLIYPQDNSKQEAPQQETAKMGSGDVCQDCIKFLTDAQEEAKVNASFVDSLIANIENQCDLLGPAMSSLCKQYVSQYGSEVIDQIMSSEPKDICMYAGFCPKMKFSPMLKLQPAKTVPMAKTVAAAKLFPATKVESANKKSAVKMVAVRQSNLCSVCEFVMKELEDKLQDPSTEEEVVKAVESVCNYLPSTLTAQCKDLVETYGEAIIQLLVQQADPKTVCTVLALCNNPSRAYVVALDKRNFETGTYCEVCKMAVSYMDKLLEANATEEQIEEAVRKVCSFLPDSMREQCDQLVTEYEPVLVQLLLQMLDPDFVCMKVGACPGAKNMLLGMEQCTLGPDYWCKNMVTATKCNAVNHCRRLVWV